MDVALVRWPEEADRRQRLREAGVARLLLVEADSPPPAVDDFSEDWIRVPAVEADLQARMTALAERPCLRTSALPTIDEGVLRLGDGWVALAPVEARLADALVDRYGRL